MGDALSVSSFTTFFLTNLIYQKKNQKQTDIFIAAIPWQNSLLPIMLPDIACPVKFLLLL